MKGRRRILVASANPGKLNELRAMLDADVQWAGLAEFKNISEVVEDGKTFAQNAREKATGYAKQTGLWTIADDSGLVVDALGGRPGVNSARFSGERTGERKIIDRRNIEKVLQLLAGVPAEKRTARFVCCLCLASPEKVLAEAQGTVEGVIIDSPRGTSGFGYDPIFFVPRLNKTIAELSEDEKNAISHRGNAIRKLKPMLDKILKAENYSTGSR